jgi:hypothetical protein
MDDHQSCHIKKLRKKEKKKIIQYLNYYKPLILHNVYFYSNIVIQTIISSLFHLTHSNSYFFGN